VGDFRGLVRAPARIGDELCAIAGGGCPYTVPIGGRPLIEHAVKAVCNAGATEILVAIDESIADVVAPCVGDARGATVHVAAQADHDEDATLTLVEEILGPGPLIFAAGDALAGEPSQAPVAADAATVVELDAAWRYDGTVDSVLEANTIVLDAMKRGRLGVDLARATLQGRAQVDPSAELEGAKLRGPVYIGPGVRLVETYVGPYTSIGANVTLEGVEIEHSIVLPGAEIRYPGRRLEASLVGEGAQIGRDYSLPSALRLRVGPHSQIQLS
jgi:NDP-sugar pyrophosphorylase family protein